MMEKVRSKQQQQQELEAAKRAAIEQLQNVYEQQNKMLHAREVFHDSIVFNYFFEQSKYDSHRFISAKQVRFTSIHLSNASTIHISSSQQCKEMLYLLNSYFSLQ